MRKQELATWQDCRRAVGQISRRLLDLLYPPQCAFCRSSLPETADSISLCDECRQRLAPPVRTWCPRCSAPYEIDVELEHDCVHCRQEKFHWTAAVSLARYRGEMSTAAVRMKKQSAESLIVALASLLYEQRMDDLERFQAELVVPMPMHWARRISRGANGPELIAEVLAQRLGIPVRRGALRRRRLTPLQTETTAYQRHSNQRGSFQVPAGAKIAGKRVLLVDDVLTTGATASEAAKTLRAAGAAEVFVAAIARGTGEEAI